MFISSGIT